MTLPARRVGLWCLPGLLLAAACLTNPKVRGLDPESRDFYAKVRYIITSEENKTFLSLPSIEARKNFMEDFWKRRDPTPETEFNEYKEEYFKRIKEANKLFSGGASPGWLQDRGRVWITLGQPDSREAYPRGQTFYGKPVEIWWYGFFPICFIDDNWTDDYRLDPLSVQQIAQINQAQSTWNRPKTGPAPAGAYPATGPQFDLRVEKVGTGGARLKLTCPYRTLWLKASGSKFQATLEVVGAAVDAGGAQIWTCKKSCPVELTQERLRETLDKDLEISIDCPLAPGTYSLKLTVTNVGDGSKSEIEKKIEI